MPELAAIYFAGLSASFLMGLTFGLKLRGKYHSPAYAMIQQNLAKIGLRWNDLHLGVENAIDPNQQINEYSRARLTSLSIIFAGMILSWLGFLLLIVIWASLKLVGDSRIEKRLYGSRLAERDLSAEEVQALVAELELKQSIRP